MTEVVVLGAGVAGLCVASELCDKGISARVIDQATGIGTAQCSWWAGGMLAPYCERESAEEAVIELGISAADWWQTKTSAVMHNGTLVLAPSRDQAELDRFARRTREFEQVNADQIAALEPDLAGRFAKGLHFPTEAHLDPRIALQKLFGTLVERGVTFDFETDQPPPSDITVDCRGLAAADQLPDLRGVKGEMLIVRQPEITLSRPVRLLHPRQPIYIVPRDEGRFMIGATMIESDDRHRITARSMLELLGAAYALHPAFAEAEILEIGVDARPAFPDNLPRALRHQGRIYVNGLYRHGFLLAPAMAAKAAEMALQDLEVPA